MTVQVAWNAFATTAGCGDFLGNAGLFDCLRSVPLASIRAAQDASGSMFGYKGLVGIPWWPSSDGDVLVAPPQELLLNGTVSDIPFITGEPPSHSLTSQRDCVPQVTVAMRELCSRLGIRTSSKSLPSPTLNLSADSTRRLVPHRSLRHISAKSSFPPRMNHPLPRCSRHIPTTPNSARLSIRG